MIGVAVKPIMELLLDMAVEKQLHPLLTSPPTFTDLIQVRNCTNSVTSIYGYEMLALALLVRSVAYSHVVLLVSCTSPIEGVNLL